MQLADEKVFGYPAAGAGGKARRCIRLAGMAGRGWRQFCRDDDYCGNAGPRYAHLFRGAGGRTAHDSFWGGFEEFSRKRRAVRAVAGRAPEGIDAFDGEDVLHKVEAQTSRHALEVPPPLIVGAAGWVATDPASVELLRVAPVVVHLRAQPETLGTPIGGGDGQREDATDLARLRTRHAERDEAYRQLATLTIDTDDVRVDMIVRRILAVVQRGR